MRTNKLVLILSLLSMFFSCIDAEDIGKSDEKKDTYIEIINKSNLRKESNKKLLSAIIFSGILGTGLVGTCLYKKFSGDSKNNDKIENNSEDLKINNSIKNNNINEIELKRLINAEILKELIDNIFKPKDETKKGSGIIEKLGKMSKGVYAKLKTDANQQANLRFTDLGRFDAKSGILETPMYKREIKAVPPEYSITDFDNMAKINQIGVYWYGDGSGLYILYKDGIDMIYWTKTLESSTMDSNKVDMKKANQSTAGLNYVIFDK